MKATKTANKPASSAPTMAWGTRVAKALQAADVLGAVDAKVLGRTVKNLGEEPEDGAAATLLMELPSTACPSFVFFDHHVEESVVTQFDRALDGERVRLRAITKGPAKVEVTAVVDGKPAGVHMYEDNGQLTDWLTTVLHEQKVARGLWYLPCYDGVATLVITAAQADALRRSEIPVETTPPLIRSAAEWLRHRAASELRRCVAGSVAAMLKDKVTGASRGIGEAITRAYMRVGHSNEVSVVAGGGPRASRAELARQGAVA